MFLRFCPFFIIAETPLHPGSGSELGIVDLPIQRERHTNFPKIEGSGLKGCIREAFEALKKIENRQSKLTNIEFDRAIELIFGPEDGELHAGALAFTDAKILLFPVKSLKGVFAWITCPQVLERFKEDMEIAGQPLDMFFNSIKKNTCPSDSDLVINSKIVLEEFTFEVEVDENTKQLANWLACKIFPKKDSSTDPYKYWRDKLQKDLVILSDDDFREFVTNSTEIIARTVIDNKSGIAGNLWYEEYLPQDTILYSLAMATSIRVKEEDKKGIFKSNTSEEEAEKVIKFFKEGVPEIIQIGGNQTIGKGIARLQLFPISGEGQSDEK